jgi:uncharacterized membrane protein YbhN (UPF0104 family)
VSEPQQPEREPSVEWRRVLVGVVAAVLVASGVVALIGNAAGFADLRETFTRGEPEWLVVCLLGQLLVFGAYARVYRAAVAFEGGPRVSTSLALRVVLGSFALTQLVAAGGAAGIAVGYWALRKLGFERRESAVRVIGLNTLVYLVFGLFGWTAALLALLAGEAPLALTVPWLVLVPVLLVAAWWFTDEPRVRGWAAPAGGWLRRGLAIGVSAAWWVRRALRRPEGRTMAGAAALYWIGDAVSLWAGLEVFGAEVAPAALALAYATGYVAQLTPLPFVATGGVDAATTFALTAVGVPLEEALLGVVAHRLFAFWLPVIPGLVLVALLPGTGRRLERAAATRRGGVDVAAAT